MNYTIEQLVDSIKSRGGAAGIGLASAYLNSMVPCLDGGDRCPVKLFKLASADLWQKELAEAAKRFVFSAGDMTDPDLLTKSISEGADIPSGAVLTYDAILSTRSKDRDGDIIVQKGGLRLDEKMPLLWQHIQVSPIGKHIKVLDQNDEFTKCKFAIVDTELGRDAATLVKFGALRKSHGFKPSEFEPIEIIKSADGKDIVKGWHIKSSDCFEGSLVSIPANAGANITTVYAKEFDGIVTAHSRGLLKHPMVSHWSKSLFDSRPTQVQGVTLATKDAAPPETKATITIGGATVELTTKGQAIGDTEDRDMHRCEKCGKAYATGTKHSCGGRKQAEQAATTTADGKLCPKCSKQNLDSTGSCGNCGYVEGSDKTNPPAGTKSIGEVFTKMAELSTKMIGNEYIDGSFEKMQHSLRKTARDYLSAKGIDVNSYSSYVDLMATFPESAIVCLYSYGATKSPCYRISYSADDEGNATWSGEPKSVELKQAVIEKHFAPQSIKGLSEQLVRKMAVADGSGGEVAAAQKRISQAVEVLKQDRGESVTHLVN